MATQARPHLLIVYHSRSGSTARMAEAIAAGARTPEVGDIEVRVLPAPEAGVEDVRWADVLVLGTPENFGYMSGLVKDFFERIYDTLLDETRGLPFALFVKGRSDGTGALRSIERIIKGLAWREVQPPMLVVGELTAHHLDACTELGQTVAASLDLGIL